MGDDNADWFMDDTPAEAVAPDAGVSAVASIPASTPAKSGTNAAVSIPSGPAVPNPYAHVLDPPCKRRVYTHWAYPTHLRYKYLTAYSNNYYDDYVNYMDRRLMGLKSETPRPREWAERCLDLYTQDGISCRDEWKLWFTRKNNPRPKSSIFHAVHSKGYYDRQYKSILL